MQRAFSVAVIIVTWNSSKFISELLYCLQQQTLLPDNIIVLDNASDDFLALEDAIACSPLKCRLVALQENLGFAAANNEGISLCNNDFIALLNPDAFPESGWLETLVAATVKYPEFDFFSSRQMQLNGRIDGAGDELYFWGKPYRRGYGRAISKGYLKDKPVFSACAAAAMYRRAPLVSVGGFDEEFFCYVEDVDLSFRLQLAGHKCMYIASAVVRHIGSASLGKRSDFSVYYGQRNMLICFIKNMPSLCLFLFVPFHLVMSLLYILAAILIGRSRLVLDAKLAAVKKMPIILNKRSIVQKTRRISVLKLISMFKFGIGHS